MNLHYSKTKIIFNILIVELLTTPHQIIEFYINLIQVVMMIPKVKSKFTILFNLLISDLYD
jgi:hypothetical protein